MISLLMKSKSILTFFTIFWTFMLQNRVLQISKGLFRETYSIKKFIFDTNLAYQSCKLTAGLHLTRKENLFILETLNLIKKVVR